MHQRPNGRGVRGDGVFEGGGAENQAVDLRMCGRLETVVMVKDTTLLDARTMRQGQATLRLRLRLQGCRIVIPASEAAD